MPLIALVSIALATLLSACMGNEINSGLQSRIDAIVERYPHATIAVAVRDPSGERDFDHNGDTLMHAASTMKVPVMIEIFRRAESGAITMDDSLQVTNEFTSIYDGSVFRVGVEDDSDKEIYEAVGGKMTIRELTHRLITSSSNLATNLLIDLVSADSVQQTIEAIGTRRMQVLRGVEDLKAFNAGLNNVATATDLSILMDALLNGRAVSPEASRNMVDILAAVPSFRMVSDGIPEGSRVAHKTGSIPTRNHRHDAAIVFPPNGQPYVIVIMTRDAKTRVEAEEIGGSISRVVYEELRG